MVEEDYFQYNQSHQLFDSNFTLHHIDGGLFKLVPNADFLGKFPTLVQQINNLANLLQYSLHYLLCYDSSGNAALIRLLHFCLVRCNQISQ